MDWLLASLLFGLRIALLGAVVAPGTLKDGTLSRMQWLAGWGRVVCIGIVLNLILMLLAAQCAIWTPVMDWLIWSAAVGVGLVVRRTVRIPALRTATLMWWAATSALVGLAMLTPLRSEWLAGGWDPGMYQNESLAIARLNGLQPETDTVYALMTPEQRALFVRSSPGYNEILPSMPIDMESGALGRYFFPMTPLIGALMSRVGGTEMLCRLGTILGFLSVPVFWTFLCVLALPLRQRIASAVVWCLVPMAWYQGAIPTSEHLQIVLLLSAAALYLEAMQKEKRVPLLLGCVLFAAVTNRFSFPALCAVMLPVCAVAEALAHRKGYRGRWWVCFVALSGGLLWDLAFTMPTLLRLHEKDNAVVLVVVPFIVGALCARGIAQLPLARWPIRRVGLLAAGIIAFASLALGVLCILFEVPALRPSIWAWCQVKDGFSANVRVLLRMTMFGGTYVLIVSFLSAALLAFDRRPATRGLRVVVVAFAGALLLLAINPAVANLYPWALRRYLVFMMPLLALLGGYGIWRVLSFVPRKSFLAIDLCLVLFAWAAVSVRQYDAALRVGDYAGMSSVLETLQAHIPDDAIVIADDARWGTPLAMQNGTDVINGRLLWTVSKSTTNFVSQEKCLNVLSEIAQVSGRDLVWLTSTDRQLSFYDKLPITHFVETADLGSFDYHSVIHSRNADHFATAERTAVFRLFEGRGETVWAQDRAPASARADMQRFAAGRTGYVVWESRRPSGTAQLKYRIWKRNLDGSGLEMISGVPRREGYAHQGPRISPDGRWVAFAGRHWNSEVDPDVQTLWGGAYVAPPFDIWLVPIDPDTGVGEPRELTCVRGRAGSGGENRVIEWKDARTLHVTLPENNSIYEVDIHNDRIGRRVVSDLVIEHKGATLHREAVLSPDGQTLLCAQGQAASYQRRDTDEIEAPSHNGATPLGGCQTFVVPDAPWIVWMGGIGSNLRALALSDGAHHELSITHALPARHQYFYFPAASRKGSLMVIGASDFHDHSRANYELFAFNIDTDTFLPSGSPVRLTYNGYEHYSNRGLYPAGSRHGHTLDRWPDVFVQAEVPDAVPAAAQRAPHTSAYDDETQWGRATLAYARAIEEVRPVEASSLYYELVDAFGTAPPGQDAQVQLAMHAEKHTDLAVEHEAWHQLDVLRTREQASRKQTPKKRAAWHDELRVRVQQMTERYPHSRAALASVILLREAGLESSGQGDAFTHDLKVCIVAVSQAPKIKEIAPYDEAFVTFQCEILKVKEGALTAADLLLSPDDAPAEGNTNGLPMMFGNVMAISGGKHLPPSSWAVDQVVRLRAARWDAFPFFNQHPLADDIMDFDSHIWYVTPVKPTP